MKRSKRAYLALGLAALMALQQPAAAFAVTGEAAAAATEGAAAAVAGEAAAAAADPEWEDAAYLAAADGSAPAEAKTTTATASDALKTDPAGAVSAGKTGKASAANAEKDLFDEDGTLIDGEVIADLELPDGPVLEGRLGALLGAQEATPLNAKKSILDMEIRTAEGVLQAGDVLQEAEPLEEGVLQGETPDGMQKEKLRAMKAGDTDALDEAIARLEDAADNWDGTEVEVAEGLAYGFLVDLSDLEIPVDQENKLFSRFLNRNPQYFFLSSSYLALPAEDELYIGQMVPLIDMTYTIDDVQVFADKVDEIVSYVDPAWSDEEKVLWLHDYIILTTAYDLDFSNSVTWTSSNPGVATVTSSGLVKAVKAGTAVITVKTVDGGKTATCKVTVSN